MLDTQPTNQTKCIVFMPARNCEMYAAEALRSLSRQTHEDIFVVYVDDASEDQTGAIARHHLATLFPGRHDYIRNEEKFGKSRNIWEHLRPRAADGDFIAILDADDQLEDPGILAEMANCYAAGQDVVWTNFFTDTGHKGMNQPLDPAKSPRVQGWRTSHFFSFRAGLLGNIPEPYFKDSAGQWFMGACDVALAIPVLDQTRNYAFIPKLAYRYTASNPFSLHNLDKKSVGLSSTLQSENAQQIMRMKPLPVLGTSTAEPAVEAPAVAERAAAKPSAPEPMPAVAPATTSEWEAKAAEALVAAHPALLTVQAMGQGSLTALQTLALKQLVSKTPGEVLTLGGGDIALSLAALCADLGGARVTALVDDAKAASELYGKACLAGVEAALTVVDAPRAPLRMGGQNLPFPSLTALEDTASYALVVADARGEENEAGFAVLGLPALANQLSPTGFHYCVMTSSLATAQSVAEGASALASSLTACPGAIGGTGCVIFANEKE